MNNRFIIMVLDGFGVGEAYEMQTNMETVEVQLFSTFMSKHT